MAIFSKVNPLDWVYPSTCHFCKCRLKNGRALCDDCCARLPSIDIPFCDICGENFPGEINDAFKCTNCTGISFHFEFARAAMKRSEEMLDLLHRFKYNRDIHLARDLGLLAHGAFSDRRLQVARDENWLLIPVPLHRSRQSHRYFNQALEIAKVLGKKNGLKVDNCMKRLRKTETQTRLNRNQRMENLRGAFALKKNQNLVRKATGVILVDDVFTTGSTVDACAKVLRSIGVPRVAVITVMRG